MGPEWIVVGVIAVAVLFGAKKIPEMARSVGRAQGEFKRGMREGVVEEPDASSQTPGQTPPPASQSPAQDPAPPATAPPGPAAAPPGQSPPPQPPQNGSQS